MPSAGNYLLMAFPYRLGGCVLPCLFFLGAHAADVPQSPLLTARVMTTIQYAHSDIYFRTPPGQGPQFSTTREIVAGQRLDVVVMVHGAAADERGMANVVFDLSTRGPEGSVPIERKDLRLAVDRPSRLEVIHFPAEIVTFLVKEGEPAGDYHLEVTVRDRVSGRSAVVSQVVSVQSDSSPLPWPVNANVREWQVLYYTRPQPRLFLPALLQLSQLQGVRDRPPQGQGPLLGFADQVLKDNPWLVPQLKAHARATGDEWEKRLLSLVLAYALRDTPEMLEHRSRDLLKILPVETEEPLSGTQLDLLWGRFLARGDFDPIQRLVQIVERYSPYQSDYEAYAGRAEPRGAPTLDERKGLIRATALWSLGSNARQHKRITHYLTTLRDSPGANDAVKDIIAQVLADPAPLRPGRPGSRE